MDKKIIININLEYVLLIDEIKVAEEYKVGYYLKNG